MKSNLKKAHQRLGWWGLALLAVSILGLSASFSLAGPPIDAPIGDQPGTRRVELANGLGVVVVSVEGEQPGDVQAWLIIRAGSMYESDAQRGAAGVLEAAIKMGTEHFSSDEINEILSDTDLGYGQRTGSFVTFDQSAYLGGFERGDLGGFGRLLRLFGDVLDIDTIGLDDEKIEAGKGELVDRLENEPSASMRARQQWLPELMHGTPIGDRLPSPSIESLDALTPDSVRGFADAYNRPAQATLIVVGDVDADEVIALAGDVLGKIPAGARRAIVDGRVGGDLSMRTVMGSDPELEGEQGAMIWFRDRIDTGDGDLTRPWSERAAGYTLGDMRSIVVDRVAGEIVRYRLGRLSTVELGAELDLGVDQVDLWGQIDLTQIGIESGSDDDEDSMAGSEVAWSDSIRFLVLECDRLTRDGATDAEIRRARRSVLSRWHRDADDWAGSENNAKKMGLIHWLITTGRPVIDMVRWDRLATGLMSEISDEEIDKAVRGLVDPRSAAYVAIVPEVGTNGGGSSSGEHSDPIRVVIDEALGSPLAAIDPLWMDKLVGALIDEKPTGGKIDEVSQHPGSGVWSGVLSNGVRLWVRRTEGPVAGDGQEGGGPDIGSGRVSLSATLWSGGSDSLVDLDALDAALSAWDEPTSESRSRRMISGYMNEHDLRVATRRGVGYVQLRVDGPRGALEQAVELMFVLLDRPMIEGDVFARWQRGRQEHKQNPLDRGLEELYATGSLSARSGSGVSLDDAQRALTQIVRNRQIDIGIAGAIDAQGVLEDAAAVFGTLVERQQQGSSRRLWAPPPNTIAGERSIRVESDDVKEQGVVIGYIGAPASDLGMLRALTLAAMVLDDRIEQQIKSRGFAGEAYTYIGYSDAIPGRVLLIVRALSSPDTRDEASELIGEAIAGLVHDGIGDDELASKQTEVVESIDHYFDSPRYWSRRLSTLGVRGRRVDDLWEIRNGYRLVEPDQASRVFSELIAGNERFRVEIVAQEKAAP